MALRCKEGFLRGLCPQPNCPHSDHGRVPRIEETGVQVAGRRPSRVRGAIFTDGAMVEALDGDGSLADAARQVGCTIASFYARAKTSPSVREALRRRRERGHRRRRRPCSPVNESKAQIIERLRVSRTDVPSATCGTDALSGATRERDVANLSRLQQSRPLAPPGMRSPCRSEA